MKKLITIIMILTLALPVIALADLPDISSLTFNELVQLREQINLAIWNSQEWQEVTVPIGVWKIGEDIPIGKWTIAISPDAEDWCELFYCSKLDNTGLRADWGSNVFFYCQLESDGDTRSVDIDCKDGTYIIVERVPVIFRPYSGKPDLGFK